MNKTEIELLATEIIRMADEDQAVRTQEVINWDAVKKIDEKNRLQIKEIIAQYGYISARVYGRRAATSAWILVQHFPKDYVEDMESYLALIKQDPEGIPPANIATLEDRICMYKGEPQIYGSQAHFSSDSNVWQFHGIVDIANVDERRREVGMSSLREYAENLFSGEQYLLPEGYEG